MTLQADGRRELAERLRLLRKQRGLTQEDLAKRLGWTQARVSRVDRGTTLPRAEDVDAWAGALQASGEERATLAELADALRVQMTAWRREMAIGRRRVQAEIRTLEERASTIWAFSLDVVPGLLQTAAYAEMMFRLGRSAPPEDEDLAAVVAARIARQAALEDGGKTVHLLCTETAFRRSLLGRDAMVEQVERVIAAAERGVAVGVIAFAAYERTQTYHAFAVIGDPAAGESSVVVAETVTHVLTVRDEDEIAAYIGHFNDLWAAATTGDDLVPYLREVAASAPWY
jgi:transcriptional regulator with XRE-family HTH domain